MSLIPLAMKKLLLFGIIFIFISTVTYSQKRFNLSIHHDTKFLFIGDNLGNSAGTLDLIAKIEIPIKNFSNSYIIAYPSFEYVDLHSGSSRRYAIGSGYIQKNVFLNNLNLGALLDYGFINRLGNSTSSFGLSIEAFYKVTSWLSLSYIHQIIERSDLVILYNEIYYIRPSSFAGFKFHF